MLCGSYSMGQLSFVSVVEFQLVAAAYIPEGPRASIMQKGDQARGRLAIAAWSPKTEIANTVWKDD
jgi:hypothetical protein